MPECCVLIPNELYEMLTAHPLFGWMVRIERALHYSGDHTFETDVWLTWIESPLIKPVSDGRMPLMRYLVFEGDTIRFPEEDFPGET